MTSLHISHTVRDFDEWRTTFDSFGAFRADGGVTSVAIRRGVDDPNHVAIDLQFDDPTRARAFLARLESEVWPRSPHFDGTPTTSVLEDVGAGA